MVDQVNPVLTLANLGLDLGGDQAARLADRYSKETLVLAQSMDGSLLLESLGDFCERTEPTPSAFLVDVDSAMNLSLLGKEESESQSSEQQDYLLKAYLER